MALVTRLNDQSNWWWCGLLLAWMLVSGHLGRPLNAEVLTEYEVKAGMLYHCGWFVEWPARTAQGRAQTIVIGVLGTNPFGHVLNEIMRHKSIHERPVLPKYYQDFPETISSHILFISVSEEARLPAILEGLSGTSVLTVSDMERFAERGGMIELRLVDRKVQFNINLDAAERAGLKLSSQLLRLARVIHSTRHER